VGVFSSLFRLFSSGKKTVVKRINLKKRFNLEGRLGQGSMSRVFRAYDRELGRQVCVKLLDKAKTARFDARFVGLKRPNEGTICQALKHRNVVQTFEWGLTQEGEQYLVMELIVGVGMNFLVETKHEQLKGNRIAFLMQAAEGIAYVHDQGYMHRDICPRNIMVTTEGVVKLIDFGLSIPNRPEFRRPGNRTGTANYMAPELIKRSSTDHRVDLFALGVTAYETFVGALPWEGAQSLQTMLSHVNQPGRDPREVDSNIDDRLAEFLIKAIQRDPRDRYQTATEFRDALKDLPRKNY
jgi:serine/threonine protein kinase